MPSHLSVAPRRLPRQQRGQRRVSSLLRAAASVIGEAGYDLATMCAIAERANSSIGSLYQFFPNKESVIEALRAQYVQELQRLWSRHAAEAASQTVAGLVSRLVSSQIEFAERHPAFLALLDAPRTRNSARRREIIRGQIARLILARKPAMPRSDALRLAAVVQQILKGLLTLYARAEEGERTAIRSEFTDVLTGYLTPRL